VGKAGQSAEYALGACGARRSVTPQTLSKTGGKLITVESWTVHEFGTLAPGSTAGTAKRLESKSALHDTIATRCLFQSSTADSNRNNSQQRDQNPGRKCWSTVEFRATSPYARTRALRVLQPCSSTDRLPVTLILDPTICVATRTHVHSHAKRAHVRTPFSFSRRKRFCFCEESAEADKQKGEVVKNQNIVVLICFVYPSVCVYYPIVCLYFGTINREHGIIDINLN
jgi:hypothetical protein